MALGASDALSCDTNGSSEDVSVKRCVCVGSVRSGSQLHQKKVLLLSECLQMDFVSLDVPPFINVSFQVLTIVDSYWSPFPVTNHYWPIMY